MKRDLHVIRKTVFRTLAIVSGAALLSMGAVTAVAAPGDSSTAHARFLSGTLLTSGGALDSLAGLAGSTASNAGTPAPVTQTNALDLSVLSLLNVQLPNGVSVPLSEFLKVGVANHYAQASDDGVSRAASGAVSDSGIVDLGGTGAFPADASIDLVNLLGNPAAGVLDTAVVKVGAVNGVAALDASQSGSLAVACTALSSPEHCRDYNVASASLDLSSPLIGTLVSSINSSLDTASGTVNGLSAALLSAVELVVNDLLGVLSGGQNDLNVTVSADLRAALSSVLSGSLSEGGVTLSLDSGTIAVDLDAVIGGLNNRAPNTSLLSADVINTIVGDLATIFTTLETDLNATIVTALNAVPVTISGGICMPLLGCSGPLGGKLSLSYNGTLADLASGNAIISASGTGAVPAILAPVVTLLTSTLGLTLAGVVNPVLTSVIGVLTVDVSDAIDELTTALDPVLGLIGAVIAINLNVQEAGAVTGSYREVALRVSLLSGAGATVDLGRAEVGSNGIAPVVTSLSPVAGPETGGTVVTVTGAGFTGATGVTFDGDAGSAFTVDSDSQLTVTTPAHVPGAVDVVVVHPAGDSVPGGFTYLADAVTSITDVDPGSGPEAGGTVVTITGICFTGATEVLFGSTSATSFTVVSDTQITAVAPAGTGIVDVTVTGSATCGDATDPGGFEYIADAVPVWGTISPVSGPVAGGTVVTVTGSGFTGATSMTFDGLAGSSFTVLSDTEIEVTTPPHSAGLVDVLVQHPGGTAGPGGFTYLADAVTPVISGLAPTSGPEVGGTVVTVTGSGFTDATGVTFDGDAGLPFTVVSDTEITVTTPAHAPGLVDVVVVHPDGDSVPGGFTYMAAAVPPTVSGLAPTSGPEVGGTVVTVTGTGFTGATDVTFDGDAGSAFTVDSDSQITVTTPAHVPGAVDVVVVHPAGNSGPGEFTYLAATTITAVDPGSGPEAGGTVVTITGHCFLGATQVLFGTTAATSFTVVSDTQITAVAPAGTGTVDVTVIGSATCGDATDPGGFEYTSAAGQGGLAFTGTEPGILIGMGLLFLLLGAWIVNYVRRNLPEN